jgi:alcohol dehydrogenase (cytochrome c)
VTDEMLRNPPPGDWLHWRRTYDGWAYRDGKVLWKSPRLNDIPNAFPITYMVDGKQYIAMPVGNPGLQGNSALYAAPENGAVRGSKSSVLWVWELP